MRVLRDYWVSLATLGIVAIGLVILVLSQHPGNDRRTAQLVSQKRLEHHLQVLEAAAAAANARDLAHEPSSDRQALADAPVGAGGAGPAESSTTLRTSSRPVQPGRFPGPLASGHYVDCGTVGHVVSIQDPSSDLETLYSPWLASKFPSVDLIKVSVAVAGETLCVDFTATAPPKPSTFYIFQLGRPQQQLGFVEGKWKEITTNNPSLGIDVIFGPNGERAATLRYPGVDETPNLGIVPARVGLSGSSTSLVIDRRLFPSYVPPPPWWWSAEGVGWTGLRSPQQVTDTDPANRAVAYP